MSNEPLLVGAGIDRKIRVRGSWESSFRKESIVVGQVCSFPFRMTHASPRVLLSLSRIDIVSRPEALVTPLQVTAPIVLSIVKSFRGYHTRLLYPSSTTRWLATRTDIYIYIYEITLGRWCTFDRSTRVARVTLFVQAPSCLRVVKSPSGQGDKDIR